MPHSYAIGVGATALEPSVRPYGGRAKDTSAQWHTIERWLWKKREITGTRSADEED